MYPWGDTALGDSGDARDAHTSSSILLLSCSFQQTFCQIIRWRSSLWVWRSPSGKSLIRHCTMMWPTHEPRNLLFSKHSVKEIHFSCPWQYFVFVGRNTLQKKTIASKGEKSDVRTGALDVSVCCLHWQWYWCANLINDQPYQVHIWLGH